MKMIISDYDGTIKRFRGEPNIIQRIDLIKDLKRIREFINDGNKFTISSERTTSSMKEEIKKYKIPYDYLTTYGGLVTIDKDDKLIYAEYLSQEILKAIEKLLISTDLIKEIKAINTEGKKENNLQEQLILIGLEVKKIRNVIDFLKSLNIDINNYHFSYSNNGIWIHNIINKNIGITNLLKHISLEPEEIITVGDSFYDLKMINEYDGWCIKHSELNLYNNETMNVTPNIRTLIKTIK